jgi:hypothetical protein
MGARKPNDLQVLIYPRMRSIRFDPRPIQGFFLNQGQGLKGTRMNADERG